MVLPLSVLLVLFLPLLGNLFREVYLEESKFVALFVCLIPPFYMFFGGFEHIGSVSSWISWEKLVLLEGI